MIKKITALICFITLIIYINNCKKDNSVQSTTKITSSAKDTLLLETQIYLNDTLCYEAVENKHKETINYLWITLPQDTLSTEKSFCITNKSIKDTGIYEIYGFINYSDISQDTQRIILYIRPGYPNSDIQINKTDSIFIDSVYTIKANPSDSNGNVTTYLWDKDLDGTFEDTTSADSTLYSPYLPNKNSIALKVMDDDSLFSDTDTLTFYAYSKAIDTLAYIYDTITIYPLNDKNISNIDSVFWVNFKNDTISLADSIEYSFNNIQDTGLQAFLGFIHNNNEIDSVRYILNLSAGLPQIDTMYLSENISSDTIVTDSAMYIKISSSDENGYISGYKWEWENNDSIIYTDPGSLYVSFSNKGSTYVVVNSIDNDMLYSRPETLSLYVNYKRPYIYSFRINPGNLRYDTIELYKDKEYNLSFEIQDLNLSYTIASVHFDMDNDFIYEDSLDTKDSDSQHIEISYYPYTFTDTGINIINIYAKISENIKSLVFTKPLRILQGRPVVILYNEEATDSLYYISCYAQDYNGVITSLFWSIDTGQIYHDTVNLSETDYSAGYRDTLIIDKNDTSYVELIVMDNDSILSEKDTITVFNTH